MCKIICITNRALCRGDFITRVRDIVDCDIPVVLREKDLTENQYYDLLRQIGRKNIITHSFASAALKFGCDKIHMPLPLLKNSDISDFTEVGASAHSLDEAMQAKALGATYITAGHIFETDCKKGLPPKGTRLITEIKAKTDIAVYALGGITPANAAAAIAAGADGICVMSGFMKCESVVEYIKEYKHIL